MLWRGNAIAADMKIRCVRFLTLFRAQHPAGMSEAKANFQNYTDEYSFFLSPALLMKIWTILLARFTSSFLRISFSSLRGILRVYPSVYPRTLSESSVVPRWTLGRSINFKTSDRRSVCKRVTPPLTFGTPGLERRYYYRVKP